MSTVLSALPEMAHSKHWSCLNNPESKGGPACHGNTKVSAQALSLALLGDREKALDILEQAFSDQNSELVYGIRYPALDSLRSDPRYADLTRRLGLPE